MIGRELGVGKGGGSFTASRRSMVVGGLSRAPEQGPKIGDRCCFSGRERERARGEAGVEFLEKDLLSR